MRLHARLRRVESPRLNPEAPSLAALAAILAAGAAGAWWLRCAWSGAGRHGRLVGCSLLVAATVGAALVIGTMRGTFVALTLISVCALAVVAAGLERRVARAARQRRTDGAALEPLERTSVWWRTTLRWLLAGPIGMIAALAVGIAWAVWVPGEAQTRLVIGGLLVPIVWGGAMAWTLSDNRILRATAVLVGTAVVGFAASILRGFS